MMRWEIARACWVAEMTGAGDTSKLSTISLNGVSVEKEKSGALVVGDMWRINVEIGILCNLVVFVC